MRLVPGIPNRYHWCPGADGRRNRGAVPLDRGDGAVGHGVVDVAFPACLEGLVDGVAVSEGAAGYLRQGEPEWSCRRNYRSEQLRRPGCLPLPSGPGGSSCRPYVRGSVHRLSDTARSRNISACLFVTSRACSRKVSLSWPLGPSWLCSSAVSGTVALLGSSGDGSFSDGVFDTSVLIWRF